jgi:AcrR family transcriptional regulator
VDEIADAADVGRRTVFDHFPTKEAILFDHLVVRREVAVERLRERPDSEPPLASLHAVMRELCEEGYDRELLDQIRVVLRTEPRFAYTLLSVDIRKFEKDVITILQGRLGPENRSFDAWSLTLMVFAWFDAAVRLYLFEGARSLAAYFDDVVATCLRSADEELQLARARR